MIRLRVEHLALAMACVCAGLAHGQTASATADPQKDPAPRMKVQILSQNSQETTYAVIFGKGDEVMAGLTEFAQEKHLGASRITGIGGIEDATIGFFDRKLKAHGPIQINQPAEVLSLLGDIAVYQGKPVVHLHMVVGFSDGSAHGGHLLKAHVWPTMEVIVTDYPNVLNKKLDPESGAALIEPQDKP